MCIHYHIRVFRSPTICSISNISKHYTQNRLQRKDWANHNMKIQQFVLNWMLILRQCRRFIQVWKGFLMPYKDWRNNNQSYSCHQVGFTCWMGPLSPQHGVLNLRRPPAMEGNCEYNELSSSSLYFNCKWVFTQWQWIIIYRQAARDGPPALGLGMVLTTPLCKKEAACYEPFNRALDLGEFFG
jgi:hypothetical protein